MKLRVVFFGFVLAAMAALLLACGDDTRPPSFTTTLAGANEVPANSSQASGTCTVTFDKFTTQLTFQLVVANLQNPVAAHLHNGAPGANAGVVLPFFSGPANSGVFNGTLASGVKTAGDLSGGMAGQPLTALLDQLKQGNIYCNVHTSGTGITAGQPGNIPGGEIRGQMALVANNK